MRIDILTLFPDMFKGVLDESILKIAQEKKKICVKLHNIRDWTSDKHRTADDKPYGGGSGMVMKIEPIYRSLAELLSRGRVKKIIANKNTGKYLSIVLLTPKGRRFDQDIAKKLSKVRRLILICGHYEGVDERVRELVTDEISIGDYVLTGGELAAMVVLDAVSRLIPGVLGDRLSLEQESFEDGLLEYPQYTRPREFEGLKVPDILLSGDHSKIRKWRVKESLRRTNESRKDLLQKCQ